MGGDMHDLLLATALLFEVETTTEAPRPENAVCEIVETTETKFVVACTFDVQHV
jgi:hypothetical protein